jgi:hypothetical protein
VQNEQLAISRASLGQGSAGTWSVETDPITGEQYRINSKSGETQPIEKPGSTLLSRDEFAKQYQDQQQMSVSPEKIDEAYNEYQTNNQPLIPLDSGTLTKVQTMAGQFGGEQIVKDYNIIGSKLQSISKIIQSGVGGPGDLAVVYEFMKGLDPTSVVRETEYASAAKSGNIFKGAMTKFNGYFKEQGGFLPDNVKDAFKDIVNSKFEVATTQYNNLYDEYARRINNLTGKTDGTNYLTDYAGAFGLEQNQSTEDPLGILK